MSHTLWSARISEDMVPAEMHPDDFTLMVEELNNSIMEICVSYGVK